MLSWITGPRGNDDAAMDTASCEPSVFEPPETPAPLFAVNAFKYALFGTPAPEETVRSAPIINGLGQIRRSTSEHDHRQQSRTRDQSSPTKPVSILMTPGTMNVRRKNVTFGTGVQGNGQGSLAPTSKKNKLAECPGNFPTSYIPKYEQRQDRKLQQATDVVEPPFGLHSGPRARDDSDVTIDVLEPRSHSGKYWKEAHEAYATKSEKETRKLIAKHKLAKDFAKKKDGEAAEARLKLETERKKHRNREKSWEASMKDMQERLRKAVADNAKYAAELALLRQQIETRAAKKQTPSTTDIQQQPVGQSGDIAFELPVPTSDWSRPRMSPSPFSAPDTSKEKHHVLPESSASAPVLGSFPSAIKESSTPVSSDPIPTPTPSGPQTMADQGSRGYHISSRSVTLTTARVREPGHITTPPRMARKIQPGPAKQPSPPITVAEESDLDLWAISNIEIPNMDGSAPPTHHTVSSKPDSTMMPQTFTITEPITAAAGHAKSPTRNHVAVGKNRAGVMSRTSMLDRPNVGSDVSKEVPKYSPGSPRPRVALTSSLANSRTALPLSREEQARQRVLARRAQRKTKDDLQEKENMGAVLSTVLGN